MDFTAPRWLRLSGAIAAALSIFLTPVAALALDRGVPSTTLSQPSCGNWSVTFKVDAAATVVGALQVQVDFSGAVGEFVRDGAAVWCTKILDHVEIAANEFTEESDLVLGMISVEGIGAGTSFATCVFAGTFDDPPVAENFAVTIEDSTNLAGEPIELTVALDVVALHEPGECEDRCGDGVVFDDEECDDANTDDDDACRGDCALARCGDGVVYLDVEDCDDGNTSNTDDCLANCTTASCGDGFVEDGVETCDDGNDDDSDQCAQCAHAFCGDGYVRLDSEQCDDAATVSYDGCSRICSFEQTCGNPVADGAVKTSDALRVLQKAVGLAVDCPLWACDVNESGATTVSDALAVLQVSVEIGASLACGLPKSILLQVYRLNVGNFPIESVTASLSYSDAPGELVGEGASVECESLLPGATAMFTDDDGARVLSFDVRGQTFMLPRDLARCTFTPTAAFGRAEFTPLSLSAVRADGIVLGLSHLILAAIPD
jgi:cysteine-rich repeat protein